jgi:protein-tyrosine phosphatase
MPTSTRNTETAEPTRHIELERVFNFRDLGGYPTRDGRTTKWQTLFRADGIHRLSDADVDTLRPLGLRTIIDLRTPDEIEEHGRFPLDSYAAAYHHQPVLDVIWTPEQIELLGESPTFLVDRYREMLVIGDRALGESLRLFGASDTYPAVFHCAAGKDRTGILAALVLGLIGVPDEVIAEDYALSRDGMVRMIEWVKANVPEARERLSAAPTPLMSAEPDTILALLDHIRAEQGSLEDYVLTLGVEADHIAGMRAALLG